MINVLFSAADEKWPTYGPALNKAFHAQNLPVHLHRDISNPSAVDFLVFAPNGPVKDFTPFTKAKAVLSLWAGVENLVTNKTLKIPLTRMVDTGLNQGMVEWVTGHVLRHHLGIDAQLCNQNGEWKPIIPPLAKDRKITILGLGELGQACAQALVQLNFDVAGWSRTPKDITGIACHSGPDGLLDAISQAEILILLLPLTAATENTLNSLTLHQLPKGAVIINPGRGALIDDDALLAALKSNHIAHATLDVFRIEPLPKDHAYWAHPHVTVTPHIASETRPDTAAQIIADNISRSEKGADLRFLVNKNAGY